MVLSSIWLLEALGSRLWTIKSSFWIFAGQSAIETDGQEPQCPDSLFNQHLYWWDQVPKQLQFNRYIRSGYRAGKWMVTLLGNN